MNIKHMIVLAALGTLLFGGAQATEATKLSTPPPSGFSFLKAEGKRIVNEQGEPVLLRGMGLGGWMLQEGYMLQLSNLGQQHRIKASFQELIGPEATETFYKEWRANHTRKEDIDAMAAWGFNSVRLPMHYELFTPPIDQEKVKGKITWREDGFKMVDELLAWCKANNIYLILDLHAAPGGQGNDVAISDRDTNKPSLWDSPENQAKMIALWRKLAQRYANEPAIAAYDIINEPNWGFESKDDKNGCKETQNAPLRDLMIRTTKAIREVDNKHLVVVEGNCWGNNYKGVMPAWDNNMALSFHKYWNYNTADVLTDHLALRDTYNIPLWMGESGENSNEWFSDAIRLVESKDIGWAFWPLKKIGFNNPLQIEPNANYKKVVEYLTGKGERPTKEEATQGLLQLAREDIRFDRNRFHPDVIDAMFRQPHSNTAVPFKTIRVGATGVEWQAVDYDMGTKTHVDKDAGNYWVSTQGDRTPWNKGTTYRNDGVDIYAVDGKPEQYFVGSFEADEWLEYTLVAEAAGSYQLNAQLRNSTAQMSVWVNNTVGFVASTKNSANWETQNLGKVTLVKGNNLVRVKVNQGTTEVQSFNLSVAAK